MKYKNIVFDFGNVIGRFDGKAILSEFCPYEEELDYLSEIVYKRWAELDAGTLDYDSYINEVIDQVPEHLRDCIRRFAKEWPRCTTLLPDTITFIHELKERNIPIYLLSNAPTYLQNTMKEVNFFLSLTESYFPDRLDLQNRLLKSTVIFSGNLI